jgi:HAD superfamily hydrolase (TIGR01509 family)
VEHITRRVRSAIPGAVEAIRDLHARGYPLHTASNKPSWELAGYLEGMGVRPCFGHLYGTDLVDAPKSGAAFYTRICANAGVAPAEALVVDDNPLVLTWAAAAGARTVLIGSPTDIYPPSDLVLPTLAALPSALAALDGP